MTYNSARGQYRSFLQIRKFGRQGYLRRDGVDRPCMVGIIDYKPYDASLREVGAQRALIAAYKLEVPPERDLDLLIFGDEVHRFSAPIKGPRPDGVVLFFDCEVVYDSRNS